MEIKRGMYNVPTVDIGTVSTGANTIGTSAQYNELRKIVEQSGICHGIMKVSNVVLKGTMLCNIADGGIECQTITNESNTLRVLLLWVYPDGDDCKGVLTVTNIGS